MDVTLGADIAVKYPELKPGPYLELRVSDTGYGIPATIIERIFDPFFTTKGKGEGTGMGLSVVHGIIKDHGGDIAVHSEPGKGTTFYVLLPVSGLLVEHDSKPEEPAPLGTERILFVDDEKSIIFVNKFKNANNIEIKFEKAQKDHQKGLLSDLFYFEGSMNFTYSGVYLNKEKITCNASYDPEGKRKINEAFLEFERIWDNIITING